MRLRRIIVAMLALAVNACTSQEDRRSDQENSAPRVVSLDYCADQYVLKFVDRSQIAALSPDAEASFSYMRREAHGLPKVRPRAEDILILKPDIVVRSYGGGPTISRFLDRVGVKVVQIGYASDLSSVETIILETAAQLDATKEGERTVQRMKDRLAALPEKPARKTLYMTSKGAAAGTRTLIDDLMTQAGLENFDRRAGWGVLPLERLAYEKPDLVATAYFETSDLVSDIWTPSRHPVAKRTLRDTPRVDIAGALTACSGWFLLDAVERMAHGPDQP
ncbi:MAG: ABC transporter substrate-binding protein [Pseudomonadota bacterium]